MIFDWQSRFGFPESMADDRKIPLFHFGKLFIRLLIFAQCHSHGWSRRYRALNIKAWSRHQILPAVVGPNAAMQVLFCLNFGKFWKAGYSGWTEKNQNIIVHIYRSHLNHWLQSCKWRLWCSQWIEHQRFQRSPACEYPYKEQEFLLFVFLNQIHGSLMVCFPKKIFSFFCKRQIFWR